MGLIKAGKDAIGGLMADQWREYFYCDSLSNDILMVKGQKRVTDRRNSNTKSNDNIISNGSIVAVNEGQCMIIVDQGEIVEFCADAGEFVLDVSTEPSLFYGSLGENIKKTFGAIGKRFTFGGNTAKDQRVYYFNTKENMSNLFGTANPIPFRVVDNNIGLDIDISIRCNGEFSFKITDPLLFYKNVCGNVTNNYNKTEISSQLKAELLTAMQPALAKISEMGIRYSAVPAHSMELAKLLNSELSSQWSELRGLEIVTLNVKGLTASQEDENLIKELQRKAVFRNTQMAAANLSEAQAEAMKLAAANESTGPMMAFAGMNMANMVGGMNTNQLYQMGQQQAAPQQQVTPQPQMTPQPQVTPQTPPTTSGMDNASTQNTPILGWTCSCGKSDNKAKFCAECGAQKPADAGWTCGCGSVNQGKFCTNCGNKKPEGAPIYKCDKCGWEPEDPANPPKFCPECGDMFDANDIK